MNIGDSVEVQFQGEIFGIEAGWDKKNTYYKVKSKVDNDRDEVVYVKESRLTLTEK